MAKFNKRKNVGGNSHDRAKEKAAVESFPQSEISSENSPTLKISIRSRMWQFVDQPSFQTVFGIVGGLVGTFLDGRYFSILALLASVALYRSNALAGFKRNIVIAVHVVVICSGASILYCMGNQLNKSRTHTFTPAEYANAVRSNLPLPISQQVTNIYNSFARNDQQIGEPRVDLSEFTQSGFSDRGMNFVTKAINSGKVPALDVLGTTGSFLRKKSKESEDEIFKYLEKLSFDKDAPRSDQPPGSAYEHDEPLFVPTPTGEDLQEFSVGAKVIYLTRIDTYKDAKGVRYSSELCMYMLPQSSVLMFCDGHNKVRRIAGIH